MQSLVICLLIVLCSFPLLTEAQLCDNHGFPVRIFYPPRYRQNVAPDRELLISMGANLMWHLGNIFNPEYGIQVQSIEMQSRWSVNDGMLVNQIIIVITDQTSYTDNNAIFVSVQELQTRDSLTTDFYGKVRKKITQLISNLTCRHLSMLGMFYMIVIVHV